MAAVHTPTRTPVPDPLRAFSKSEVADRLDTSIRTVDRLVADGRLATVFPRQRGVPVRVPAWSLAQLLDGHTDGGAR